MPVKLFSVRSADVVQHARLSSAVAELCPILLTPQPRMGQARWRPPAQQQTAERAPVAEAGAARGHDAAATPPRGLNPDPNAGYPGDSGPAVGSPALSVAGASQTPLIGGRQPVSA